MKQSVLAHLIRLAAEEERELRYHLGVIGEQMQRLAALQDELRQRLRSAGSAVPIDQREQFVRHALATEARCHGAEGQRQRLDATADEVRGNLLAVHRRQQSYEVLQERQRQRDRRRRNRREQRVVEAVALRRWQEDAR